MASVIKNLSSNFPTKARLMVALTIASVIGVVIFTLLRLGGDEQVNSQSASSIAMPPTNSEISRDSPLSDAIFSDESEVGQVYRQNEVSAAEELKGSGETRSHLDALRLSMQADLKPVEDTPVETPPPPSDLQKLIDERRVERERISKEESNRQANQMAYSAEGGAVNPWANFIQEERNIANDRVGAFGAHIDLIKADHAAVSKPLYDVTEDLASSSRAGGQTSPQGAPVSGYEQLLASQGQAVTSSSMAPAGFNVGSGSSMGDEEASYDYPSQRLAALNSKQSSKDVKVNTGELHYGVLQIGVNTDEISPIRAVVVEKGKIEGAVLVGNPARVGEKAVLQFTSISLNGRTESINVVALDPDTMRTGVADSVDRHTVERYSKLLIASFAEGYSRALTGTQTTTNTDGSQSEISQALPNAKDQFLVGLGTAGERFGPIFERGFDRPPTVTVEPNKSVILMFMSPLDLIESN